MSEREQRFRLPRGGPNTPRRLPPALVVSFVLPWYSEHRGHPGQAPRRSTSRRSARSPFVEGATLLVAVAVGSSCGALAPPEGFHLPGGTARRSRWPAPGHRARDLPDRSTSPTTPASSGAVRRLRLLRRLIAAGAPDSPGGRAQPPIRPPDDAGSRARAAPRARAQAGPPAARHDRLTEFLRDPPRLGGRGAHHPARRRSHDPARRRAHDPLAGPSEAPTRRERRDESTERLFDEDLTLSADRPMTGGEMNSSAASLYQIDERGLELRRTYMRMTPAEFELLAGMQAWADRNADAIGTALAEHTFSAVPPVGVPAEYANAKGIAHRATSRSGWGAAQAGHFKAIFTEPARAAASASSTSKALLGVGALHCKINLPLKWFLGTYPVFLDLIDEAMQADFPSRRGVGEEELRGRGARASTSRSSTAPSARSAASSTTTRRRSSRPSTTTRSPSMGVNLRASARPAPAATSPTCSPPCATRCTTRCRPSAPRPSRCRTCARR